MKKFLVIGLLTIGLSALPQQRASAWIKFNFSIGVNFGFEFGHHGHRCGLFHHCAQPGYYWAPQWAYHYPTYDYYYPTFTYAAQAAPQPYYQTTDSLRYAQGGGAVTHSNTTYQPVSYYPNTTYYYQSPSYHLTTGTYGSSLPSYWYGYGY